jgi:hypothetical protein
MLRSVNAAHVVIAILLAGLLSRPTPAAAQQNPFVGTWSTTQARGNITAYVDFYANGAIHLSGVVASGGQPAHVCGTYGFNQSAVQIVFNSYTPRVCGLMACDPMVPMNQPQTLGFQFPNPGVLQFSDGSVYVRAPSNPFPLPPTGCN